MLALAIEREKTDPKPQEYDVMLLILTSNYLIIARTVDVVVVVVVEIGTHANNDDIMSVGASPLVTVSLLLIHKKFIWREREKLLERSREEKMINDVFS